MQFDRYDYNNDTYDDYLLYNFGQTVLSTAAAVKGNDIDTNKDPVMPPLYLLNYY